jgi:hypothetical protein
MAYCSFKTSEFQKGLDYYKQILGKVFGNKQYLEPSSRATVNEVLGEMLGACPDEQELEKVLFDILVFIAASLHDATFKAEKIGGLVNRLFKFEHTFILQDLRKLGYLDRFVADPYLAASLMGNCRALAAQNDLVVNIFQAEAAFRHFKVIDFGKSGRKLHVSSCFFCKAYKTPKSRQVIYHVCGTMSHEACVPVDRMNKCPYCSKRNVSELTSGQKRQGRPTRAGPKDRPDDERQSDH